MAPNEDLITRVRAALKRTPGVVEKRMFGGVAFMVRGKLCMSARKERIMCRIDPALHDAALERPGARTVVMKGRQYHGWVHVAARAVAKQPDLDHWVKLALAYNAKAKASSKRRAREV